MLFREAYREKRRKSLGRSLLADIFYYSGVYDYYKLRILINLPIGFFIAFALYRFAWHRINFADFDMLAGQTLKWLLIIASTFTFAISPLFRCAIMCVLFGALGKNGQGLLSIVVIDNLNNGPVQNILSNFNLSTYVAICYLKQKEEMMSRRTIMATGPVEEFIAKKFGKSSSRGRKVIALLKTLVEPLAYDFSLSDEDKALAATIDAAEVLQQRDELLNENRGEKKESFATKMKNKAEPAWTKLKSKLSKLMAMRMHLQCNEVFDKGIKRCHSKFQDLKNKCFSILWYMPFMNQALCNQFDTLKICQASKKAKEATEFCDKMMGEVLVRSRSFDAEASDAHNLSDNILDHLRINMHYRAVAEPRNTRIYGFKEIKYRIAQNFRFLKVIMRTLKQVIGCLFVLMIYTLFRDAVNMINNFLNNIDFNNVYLTKHFWRIDKKRELEHKVFLRPLSKAEKTANGLLNPISPPTKTEIQNSWLPLAKFFILFTSAMFILFVDLLFFNVIKNVTRYADEEMTSEGTQQFNLGIQGSGFVAELVKDLMDFDYKQNATIKLSTGHCVQQPSAPDWSYSGQYILVPLGIMFLLQVIFGYVIKRITLFYITGSIFRRRDKARTVHLYNKMLFVRLNGRRLARARIRFQVERRLLQKQFIAEQSKLFANTFVQRCIDAMFKTGKCLMCEVKYRKRNLIACTLCPSTFCTTCFCENDQKCYACLVLKPLILQAEEGAVSSTRTQLPQVPNPSGSVDVTPADKASQP